MLALLCCHLAAQSLVDGGLEDAVVDGGGAVHVVLGLPSESQVPAHHGQLQEQVDAAAPQQLVTALEQLQGRPGNGEARAI